MNADTKLVVATGTTKVKKTNRSFRIWIEGNKLLQAGFAPDAQYSVHHQVATDAYPARICLKLDSEGDRTGYQGFAQRESADRSSTCTKRWWASYSLPEPGLRSHISAPDSS